MAVIIAISQGKGGACKTTVAVNLAGALNELGFKTRLYDWDPAKPDAVKWMENGNYINWIKLINKDDPVSEIEKAGNEFDVLIFDTPPNYDPNVFKAITIANFVIVPTSTNYLDQENAKSAISVPIASKKPFKILMSRIKKGTKEGRSIQEQVGTKDVCFKEIITDRNVVSQSPGVGQWIGQFAKGSDSHKQFLNLAKEVVLWTKIKCYARSTSEEVIL